MPAPIVLRTLTPEVKKVDNPPTGQPVIATKADLRDGSRPQPPPPGLIFEESFDNQSDWSSDSIGAEVAAFRWAGATSLPQGWNAAYSKQNAYPANENIRISASDSGDARNGAGKCLKIYRECKTYPNSQFGSNGVLGVLLDEGVDEIYIEFYIAFQPGWTTQDTVNAVSKIFRVFSSSGESPDFWQAFGGGEQGPLFVWSWGEDATFGLRNPLSFRGGPHGENYPMASPSDVDDIGRNVALGSAGDISLNWTSDLQSNSLTGGTSPTIPDKENGGNLPSSGTVWHRQVYGTGGTFTKLGFHCKMNSAPGVQDGGFGQYLDDQLIVDSKKIAWVGPTASPMPKWNAFAFGGNDNWYNGIWSDTDQREEWYVIDDIKVYNFLPEVLA